MRLVTSAGGHAMIVQEQGNEFDEIDRISAAVAGPGQPFGPMVPVAPLGTEPDEDLIRAAISDTGERLIVWRSGRADGGRPNRLMAARGDASADIPVGDDGKPPRARVTVRRRNLLAAARRGPLLIHVRCDEACGVHVGLLSGHLRYRRELIDVPRVSLTRAGARTVRLHLKPYQRRALRRVLRAGRIVVDVVAIDEAGNGHDTSGRLLTGRR